MTISRPTRSELIERNRLAIEELLAPAGARVRAQVLDVLARMHGQALDSLYSLVDWVSRQILPDTADSEWLSRHAAIWGVARKAAVAGGGNVTFTGAAATPIPAGTLLLHGGTSQFATIANVVVGGGGTVVATVEAVETGTRPSLDAGTELTLASPIAGIASSVIVGVDGLIGGSDEEDDESLLSRLLARIQNPPQGGSIADYRKWALAQSGVTRAWVYPQWLGIGTVGVTFVFDDREDIIPLVADVDAMQAAIDVLRPVTADVVVFAPTAFPIDLTITLVPGTDAVKTAVMGELKDLFARDGEPGGTMYRSRISEAISIAAGEAHHALVLPAADVVAAAGALPVLGEVTFT